METLAALLPAAFPCLLAAAAVDDLAHRRIDDRLCLALAALYPPAALAAGADMAAIAWHLAAGAAVLAAGLAACARGLMGGGDAKLLAAAACWTGFAALPAFLLLAALAGGLCALILLAGGRAGRELPAAPAIAAAGLAVMARLEAVEALLAP